MRTRLSRPSTSECRVSYSLKPTGRASRARIVATADQTRRRIERDLHDGARKQLVSLAVRLRMAQAAIPLEVDELAAELDRVTAGLNGALDELRELARGIHPAILAEGGLGPALRTLARRGSVPVELVMRTQARLPERVEVTAYYVVSEALANTAKHASASAGHVDVDVTDGVVRLIVEDDGIGGVDPTRGSGLVGLKDRVEATGGTMLVHRPRGEGTRLIVELPLCGDPPDQHSRLISIAPRLQLAGMRARRLRCQAEAVTFCLPDSQH